MRVVGGGMVVGRAWGRPARSPWGSVAGAGTHAVGPREKWGSASLQARSDRFAACRGEYHTRHRHEVVARGELGVGAQIVRGLPEVGFEFLDIFLKVSLLMPCRGPPRSCLARHGRRWQRFVIQTPPSRHVCFREANAPDQPRRPSTGRRTLCRAVGCMR